MEAVNQIEYNGALYNVQDAEAQKNLVYSQNETDTGKIWIDGKKIYRKVIDCGTLPNNTIKNVPMNITNLNQITDLTITTTNIIENVTIQLPFNNIGGSFIEAYRRGDAISLITNADWSVYTKTFAILEYTKTTN